MVQCGGGKTGIERVTEQTTLKPKKNKSLILYQLLLVL